MEKLTIFGFLAGLLAMFLVHRHGKQQGERDAKLEHLDEKKETLDEIAEKEHEAQVNKPILDRIRDLRDRIAGRRGSE